MRSTLSAPFVLSYQSCSMAEQEDSPTVPADTDKSSPVTIESVVEGSEGSEPAFQRTKDEGQGAQLDLQERSGFRL